MIKLLRMKIGIFTDSYLPTPTGVAISVETFRKSLEELGHSVSIFAPKFKDYKDKNPNIYRFPSFFVPIRKDAPVVWPIINFQYGNAKRLNLDIVHTMHFFTIGTLGLKTAKRLKLPLVHTYHTNYEAYVKDYASIAAPIAKWYLLNRSRKYCNACDLVISPSPSMAKQIKRYGITTQIEPLPTGINLNDFKPSITQNEFRKKYKVRNKGKLLLFVGRLGQEKNINFLIDCFEEVLKKIDSNLILIGSGPSVNEYKNKVAEKNLKDKVHFLGFLPKKEVNAAYGACDIFTFPSTTETQGIVVVEAMAAGLVPVAINKLGPSDIITNNKDGILCELDKKEFVKNIINVLTNQKLRDRLSSGAIKTANSYSQTEITKKLLALYTQAKNNLNKKRMKAKNQEGSPTFKPPPFTG